MKYKDSNRALNLLSKLRQINIKRSTLLIFCLLMYYSGIAQDKKIFFDFTSGGGRLYPNAYESHLAGPVTFFNARLGLKTLGQKEWQRLYNFPQLGIGISHIYLTTKSLGNPMAVYSFLNLPLLGRSELKLNLGITLGVAWGYNPYRAQYPYDTVIGSLVAFYTSMNLNTSVHITKSLEFLFAFEFYHLSNGNTNKPNYGINMLGAETGLRYTLTHSNAVPNKDPVPPAEKNSSFIVFGSWGWKKEWVGVSESNVGSVSAGYYRTINHKSRLSAGADLFYDEATLLETHKVNVPGNVLASGLFAGHELTISKLSIVTQLGVYIFNPNPYDPFYYTRIGLRYALGKRIITSLTMKAHGLAVDFLEWGFGYVFWKSRPPKAARHAMPYNTAYYD